MKLRTTAGIAALALLLAAPLRAAVTADEAQRLGTTLTPVGAEKAGNADGTIPEYTGGLTTPPKGFKKGDGIRPDPYADDKPRLVIDARNMAAHADKLTEATKALLRKYPSFRLDVYPTRRSAAFPAYVIDNTRKNATRARSAHGGLSIEGAIGGFPFPIPKNGYEAMWNHLVRFNGHAYESTFQSYNVDASGHKALAVAGSHVTEYPYYDPRKSSTDAYYRLKVMYSGPARRAGEGLLVIEPLDPVSKGRSAWQYLPGQRRVKLTPEIAYDVANDDTNGATTYDDVFVYNGRMDRYEFKLLGKREMYVPYNTYRLLYHSKAAQIFTPNHLNPDFVRWELHRVWVVEATLILKPGNRHRYARRLFYLDEDSWVALAADNYDNAKQLDRTIFLALAPSYDVPAPFADAQIFYDFSSGRWGMHGYFAETGGVRYTAPLPEREWTPAALAGAGVR